MKMYQWRITKYDPANRDEKGIYLKDEWTSFNEIRKAFDGKTLTFEAYQEVENAYIKAITYFLAANDLASLQVTSLEMQNLSRLDQTKQKPWADIPCDPHSIENAALVSGPVLESLCRFTLREILWCRLEAEGAFYIHFGWDYYMYIGARKTSEALLSAVRELGLFIEEMPSPYLDDEFTRQMRIAERVMRDEKDVLRKLSQS